MTKGVAPAHQIKGKAHGPHRQPQAPGPPLLSWGHAFTPTRPGSPTESGLQNPAHTCLHGARKPRVSNTGVRQQGELWGASRRVPCCREEPHAEAVALRTNSKLQAAALHVTHARRTLREEKLGTHTRGEVAASDSPNRSSHYDRATRETELGEAPGRSHTLATRCPSLSTKGAEPTSLTCGWSSQPMPTGLWGDSWPHDTSRLTFR